MPVGPLQAQAMMGGWVEAHTANGIHVGVLHQVRPDGIVLAMPQGGMARMARFDGDQSISHTDSPQDIDPENVQFFRPFFNPFFFFIPFFLLLALRRRAFF